MIKTYREKISVVKKFYQKRSIQFTISLSFILLTVIGMAAVGVTLYSRFAAKLEEANIQSTEQLLNQTSLNLETYLRSMMRISDSMYYSVIKNTDVSTEDMADEMNLLYEANKDNLVSIACFTQKGYMIGATPIATLKSELDVTKQEWFRAANTKIENLHFSTPHVQNLFDDTTYRYSWVISLSRVVELTARGNITRGILLVDMNYSGIEQLFKKANSSGNQGYLYLIDNDGEIIYHPKQKMIYASLATENNQVAAAYEDGTHQENFQGENRVITIKTVGYTGWKIVSVMPNSFFAIGRNQSKYFAILIITVVMAIMVIVNLFLSAQIARPIKQLENSVKGIESGNLETDIFIGGSHEIQHLGVTVRAMVAQLKQLMDDIVKEQEEKRKGELDALQSQINPHFLYNTLDSIVWMIEDERYEAAISMVTDLADLFRISLSKGKNIITIEDEIKHAKSYMNIQKKRYKNKFEVEFHIEPVLNTLSIVKLVVQPILENAIYYGMEFMDGEGVILVKGYLHEEDVYIDVCDNGLGMSEEIVSLLLTDNKRIRRRGSGVGLINVHQRLKLCYGEAYGLEIHSVPDEGTTVRIHIPQNLYEPEKG